MKEKIYQVKFTKKQSEKVIELCQNESARINREFLERIQELQNQIQQLYTDKMVRDAELSSIINVVKNGLENNGKTNTTNRKKTINENTASE